MSYELQFYVPLNIQ